jgi:hypothetical protein
MFDRFVRRVLSLLPLILEESVVGYSILVCIKGKLTGALVISVASTSSRRERSVGFPSLDGWACIPIHCK